MDKWKYMERQDSKWGNLFKDKGDPMKDEGESLEMIWSYSEEID